MTSLNYCRLCVNIGLDFKSLYDEHGNVNEVFELTTKYFDQTIINIDEAKHLTMICLQCWEHIWDFNNFQQAVQVAQSNLDAIKQLENVTQIEKADANVTQNLQHDPSTADKTEDCICLSESEESEAPIDTQIDANHIESLDKTDEHDLTNVDLTLDEDASPPDVEGTDGTLTDAEFDDPVGVFIGGEFASENEVRPQPEIELIDIDSDSNSGFDEFSTIRTPETLSAYESDTGFGSNLANITQSINVNHEKFGEEFNKFISKSMQSLQCAICSESCYPFHSLQQHFNQKHPSETLQILCCNLKHTGLNVISEHVLTHNCPLALTCELCGKNYVRLHYLRRHILEQHPGDNKQLSSISSLIPNGDSRKRERSTNKFRCNECGQNTSTLYSLRRHIWVHHQAKHKHKCHLCERSFRYIRELQEHMALHTGEFLYTCPHCKIGFRMRARYYEHLKRVHPDKHRKIHKL